MKTAIKSILKEKYCDDRVVLHLYLWLIANSDENNTIISTIKDISEQLKASQQQVRTAIKKLQSTRTLTNKSTNKNTILTVCFKGSCNFLEFSTNTHINTHINIQKSKFFTIPKSNKYKIVAVGKKSKPNIEPIINFEIKKEYEAIFIQWLNYKRSRKESYKSEASLKQCYDKLMNLSNDNYKTAQLIINDAIASNYAGFFKLRDNQKQQLYGNDTATRKHEDFIGSFSKEILPKPQKEYKSERF